VICQEGQEDRWIHFWEHVSANVRTYQELGSMLPGKAKRNA
jgi:hypothetical protein